MSAVKIVNLTKKYDGVSVLKQVSLKIDEGEFYVLMGPNGSGKTTLTSILACISPLSSGSVQVHGYNIMDDPYSVKSLLGYVPQSNFSSPRLTGRENLFYFASLHGMSRNEARRVVDDQLLIMDLYDDADKIVSHYSGGMRKKLEVATVLLPGIKLLVLDEPTTGFDPYTRKSFLNKMRDIVNSGKTILLVTHIGEDAELADTVGMMAKGNIIAEGSPTELKKISGIKNRIVIVTTQKDDRIASIIRSFSKNGIQETERGFRLSCDQPEKLIPKIVKTLDGAGCGVERVEIVTPTLEDVFFKLTNEVLLQ
ncbi:MAG: ATP-binding cassette domain-containing protein [Candidatus Hodarchaeales archaeon]